MADQKQSNRVICSGGLDSSQNHIFLSENKPGSATRLVNYEVGTTGGYRRINGFAPFDVDHAEVGPGTAEGRILAAIIFDNTATGQTQFITARKTIGANSYKFYLHVDGTGWVAISTGLTHTYSSGSFAATKLRWDVGNDGAKNVLAIVDSVNNALVYDGTTWAFVDSVDTGADMAHAGGDQAVNAPSLVAFFTHTLFIGGDAKNGAKGIVAFSAPDAFFDFRVASGAGQLTVGLEVVNYKPFRDTLYIFGKNAIKKALPDVTSGFLVHDVTSNIGCIATDSVIEIGGDLIFLAPDGYRPVSGTDKIGDVNLECISKPIQDLILRRVQSNDLLDVNSVVIRGKSQFRTFLGSDVYEVADAPGIIAGLRTADAQNGWEFGELLGIRASCAASRYIGGVEYVLHGDYDGVVYRQEMGSNLNGAPINAIYATPYLDLGDTETRKVVEKVTIFLRGEGDLVLTLSADYDWGNPDVENPSPYTITVTAEPFDYDTGVLYDSGATYGGILRPVAVTDVQGSFFSTRFTFSSYGEDAPYSLHAIIIEYSPKGRR